MEPGTVTGIFIGLYIATAANALIICMVAKLGLGIETDDFGIVFLTAILSAMLGLVMNHLTSDWDSYKGINYVGIIMHIMGSALLLLVVGNLLNGMKTRGFTGALIAAICISVIYWIIGLVIKK